MSGGCFIFTLLIAPILHAVSSHINSMLSNQPFTMHTGETNDETIPYKLLHIGGNIVMIVCSLVLLCNNCSKKKNAEPQKGNKVNEEEPKKKLNDQQIKKQTRTHSDMVVNEARTNIPDPFDVVNMELRKLSEKKKAHRKHKHHQRKHHHKMRKPKSEQIDDSEPCSSPNKKEKVSSTLEMDQKNSERIQQKSEHFFVNSIKGSHEEPCLKISNECQTFGERDMHVSLNETSITYNEGISKTLEGLKPREFVKGAKEMRIAQGQRVSKHAYKTLDDVESDWSSSARINKANVRYKNRVRRRPSGTKNLAKQETTKITTRNMDELPIDQTQHSLTIEH